LPTEKISAKRKSLKNGLSKPFLRHHTLAGAEGLEPSARGFGATVESSKLHRQATI
jgi:hypothetical protein